MNYKIEIMHNGLNTGRYREEIYPFKSAYIEKDKLIISNGRAETVLKIDNILNIEIKKL